MADILPDALESYVQRHSVPDSPLREELAAYTREHTQDPGMLSGPVQGALLRLLVQLCGARTALEIGTFTGYSALWMAEGMPEDGKLITLEADPEMAAIARRFWARSGMDGRIEVRLGPALESLPEVAGPLDFVFIDADKENYREYWEACVPKVRPGGLLCVDNVLWKGEVVQPKSDLAHIIVAFNEHVRNDPRVEPLILTIRDGLTVARKV